MDTIKKILKIGKIYRIEHETELKNKNFKKRNKNTENFYDGWLHSFFNENSGLNFFQKCGVDHKIKHFVCERDCFVCLVEVW